MCSQLTSKELFPLSKLLNICTSAWWTAVNTEEGAGFGGAAHMSVEEIAQELCWPHALLTSLFHWTLTRIPWTVCSGAVNTNLTLEIIAFRMAVYAKTCISTQIVGRENKWKRWVILNCNTDISCLKLGEKGVGSSVFLAPLHHNFVLAFIIQRSHL